MIATNMTDSTSVEYRRLEDDDMENSVLLSGKYLISKICHLNFWSLEMRCLLGIFAFAAHILFSSTPKQFYFILF